MKHLGPFFVRRLSLAAVLLLCTAGCAGNLSSALRDHRARAQRDARIAVVSFAINSSWEDPESIARADSEALLMRERLEAGFSRSRAEVITFSRFSESPAYRAVPTQPATEGIHVGSTAAGPLPVFGLPGNPQRRGELTAEVARQLAAAADADFIVSAVAEWGGSPNMSMSRVESWSASARVFVSVYNRAGERVAREVGVGASSRTVPATGQRSFRVSGNIRPPDDRTIAFWREAIETAIRDVFEVES